MENRHKLNCAIPLYVVVILLLVSMVLIITVPWRIVHVEGVITDFIGNDDGFGLKINGTCYWLTYNGKNNMSVYSIIGKWCKLAYTSNILFPRGEIPFYADTIYLEVYN
jgi:hypothetical protein